MTLTPATDAAPVGNVPGAAQLFAELVQVQRNLAALERVKSSPEAVAAIVGDQSPLWAYLTCPTRADAVDQQAGALGFTRVELCEAIEQWTEEKASQPPKRKRSKAAKS